MRACAMLTAVPRALRAAGAIASAISVLACSTPDDRSAAERAGDQALVHAVQVALLNDPYVDAQHVDIDSNRGVVLLSGQVGTDSDLRAVLRLARTVPGVRRVDEQLQIMDFGRSDNHRR